MSEEKQAYQAYHLDQQIVYQPTQGDQPPVSFSIIVLDTPQPCNEY